MPSDSSVGQRRTMRANPLRLDAKKVGWNKFIQICATKFAIDPSELSNFLEPWNMAFDGQRYWASQPLIDTTAELIRTPLPQTEGATQKRGKSKHHLAPKEYGILFQVILILEREGNWGPLTRMLEKHDEPLPDLFTVTQALSRIYTELQNSPKTPSKKGRKSTTDLLYEFILSAADFWEEQTKLNFRQDWLNRRQPITPATEFAYMLVYYLDKTSIKSLPKVTARVVRRRRGSFPN